MPNKKTGPVTHEAVKWPDESLFDGDEHCHGCDGELMAGSPIVPINSLAFVHVECVDTWFNNEGKANGFKLKKVKK